MAGRRDGFYYKSRATIPRHLRRFAFSSRLLGMCYPWLISASSLGKRQRAAAIQDAGASHLSPERTQRHQRHQRTQRIQRQQRITMRRSRASCWAMNVKNVQTAGARSSKLGFPNLPQMAAQRGEMRSRAKRGAGRSRASAFTPGCGPRPGIANGKWKIANARRAPGGVRESSQMFAYVRICPLMFGFWRKKVVVYENIDSLTRLLPLARPSRACGFAHIPFAASQAAQVRNLTKEFTGSRSCQVLGSFPPVQSALRPSLMANPFRRFPSGSNPQLELLLSRQASLSPVDSSNPKRLKSGLKTERAAADGCEWYKCYDNSTNSHFGRKADGGWRSMGSTKITKVTMRFFGIRRTSQSRHVLLRARKNRHGTFGTN